MKIQAGCYYRRLSDEAVVKLLYTEVWTAECSCGFSSQECPEAMPSMVYRLNDDEWPHRCEIVRRIDFETGFKGPLIWNPGISNFE